MDDDDQISVKRPCRAHTYETRGESKDMYWIRIGLDDLQRETVVNIGGGVRKLKNALRQLFEGTIVG